MFIPGDVVRIKKEYLESYENPETDYVVMENYGDGKIKVFVEDKNSAFGGYVYVWADYMFYKVGEIQLDTIADESLVNEDYTAELEDKYITEAEEDSFNVASWNDTVIELSDENTDCEKELREINNNIQYNKAQFSVLTKFFNLINTYGKDFIRNRYKNLWNAIWKKLYIISQAVSKTDFSEKLEWYKIIQYSYNAYIMEKYLHENFDWEFATNDDDHFYLKSGTGINLPDFKNVSLLKIGEQVIDCTVEAKVYGSIQRAMDYLNSEDRTVFHNADYILYYVISVDRWYLTANTLQAKKIWVRLPEISSAFVKIDQTQNGMKVSPIK